MKQNLLINPFTRIAGWPALLIGLAAMACTALAGYANRFYFDGVLDIHGVSHTLGQAFIAQGVAFLSLGLCLLLAGAIFSRSKFRIVDVAGVAALSRAPMLAVALLGFLGIAPKGLAISGSMLIFVFICIAGAVWVVTWMYNGYSVCFNMKGTRAVLSFIGAVVLATVISKAALYLLPGGGAVTANIPFDMTPERQQTVQQAAGEVIDALKEKDYGRVCEFFDERMRQGVSEQGLQDLWEQLQAQFGAFVSADTAVAPTRHKQYSVILVPCKFERGQIRLQLAFSDSGQVSGLYIK